VEFQNLSLDNSTIATSTYTSTTRSCFGRGAVEINIRRGR